ncbi:hypothetical protein [Leptothrix ochracea]|uniref:hypothetical protein n=1 Tax=Leptothrix ochracea TaxID=735331 RepID=UPI0034E22F56
MDLEFIKVGQIFAVGTIFIFFILNLDKLIGGPISEITKINSLSHPIKSSLFFSTAFSIGLISNIISNDIVSEDNLYVPFIKSESEIRVLTIAKKPEFTEKNESFINNSDEQTSICTDFNSLLETSKDEKLKVQICSVCTPKIPTKTSDVSSLYFKSKNFVYSIKNYYDELEQIHDRIEFSRSLYIIFLPLTLVYFFVFVITLIKLILVRKTKDILFDTTLTTNTLVKIYQADGVKINKYEETRRVRIEKNQSPISTLIITILLFLATYMSSHAFNHESKSFYKRVFGYYISWMSDQVIHSTNISNTNESPIKIEINQRRASE